MTEQKACTEEVRKSFSLNKKMNISKLKQGEKIGLGIRTVLIIQYMSSNLSQGHSLLYLLVSYLQSFCVCTCVCGF